MFSGTYSFDTLKPINVENIVQIREIGSMKFSERVTGIAFSPDGEYLAIRQEYKIILWNTHTAQEHRSLEHKGRWIEAFAFSADGKSLLTSAGSAFSPQTPGSILHHWNIETGQEEFNWTPAIGFASALAFNPQNPNVIALISFDRKPSLVGKGIQVSNVGIELWNRGNLIQRFTDFRQFYREGYNQLNQHLLEYSPDGKTFYLCLFAGNHNEGQVLAWEGLGSGEIKAVSDRGECFYGLKLSRLGNHLAMTNHLTGKLSVRYVESGSIVYSDVNVDSPPHRFDFDREGSILVVGRDKKNEPGDIVDIISIGAGKTIRQLSAKYIGEVTFSPDNKMLAIEMSQDPKQGIEEIALWGIPQ